MIFHTTRMIYKNRQVFKSEILVRSNFHWQHDDNVEGVKVSDGVEGGEILTQLINSLINSSR